MPDLHSDSWFHWWRCLVQAIQMTTLCVEKYDCGFMSYFISHKKSNHAAHKWSEEWTNETAHRWSCRWKYKQLEERREEGGMKVIKLNQDGVVESAEVTRREGSLITGLSVAGALTHTGTIHRSHFCFPIFSSSPFLVLFSGLPTIQA